MSSSCRFGDGWGGAISINSRTSGGQYHNDSFSKGLVDTGLPKNNNLTPSTNFYARWAIDFSLPTVY